MSDHHAERFSSFLSREEGFIFLPVDFFLNAFHFSLRPAAEIFFLHPLTAIQRGKLSASDERLFFSFFLSLSLDNHALPS